MPRDRLPGLDTLIGLFDTLPAATEAELRDDLPKIGALILAAQRQDVAVRTGDLFRGLSVQVLNGGLNLRVGLLGITSSSGKTSYGLYYGRFVEFGRRGQTVLVQRRRRVNGALRSRRRRKIAADIVATYTMKVRPEVARPFVHGAAAETAALDAGVDLADFWSRALARAGVS